MIPGLPADFVRVISQHPAGATSPEAAAGAGGATGPRAGGTTYRPDGTTWLASLPRLLDAALDRWNLRREPDLPLRWGFTALVVPVLRPGGDPGMLKLGWPHTESDVEHLALRAWAGRGAVRLLAAEPADGALLLERLDADRDLTTGSVRATSESLGELLRRLDRPAPPWAPRLSETLVRLRDGFVAARSEPAAAHRFPRRMVEQAASLAEGLLREGDLDDRLVHTDLHQGNVLWRPEPGEWAAIDPKVVAGDPHWAVAPALWNRWPDALTAHDLGGHLVLRLDLVCDAAGLDRDRARAMTIVRLVDNALWALREQRDDVDEEVTRAVAVVKAMQRG